MHDAAFAFYKSVLKDLPPFDVLEFGSYNINGSVRDAYPQAKSWWGIDIAEGNGVDEVADATIWKSDKRFDIVICAEAFEHTVEWRKIVKNAFEHLKEDGWFIASCASRDRPAHSAFDGGALREGEYYHNVSKEEMVDCLLLNEFVDFEVIEADGYFGNDDLYIKAVK
jgi:SAM-dependent methyltransferase